MSLLIKALDKAQAEKAATKQNTESDVSKDNQIKSNNSPAVSVKQTSAEALSLSPPEEGLTSSETKSKEYDEVPKALKDSAANIRHQESSLDKSKRDQLYKSTTSETGRAQAANVFIAKQAEPSKQKVMIAMLIGMVALLLFAAFAYWYQYVFNEPDIVIPPRPALTQTQPAPLPQLALEESPVDSLVDEDVNIDESDVFSQRDSEVALSQEPQLENQPESVNEKVALPVTEVVANKTDVVKDTLTQNETVVLNPTNINASEADENERFTSEKTSIDIKKTQSESDVNPILLRAYEAYLAGNDNQAQTDYKLVLQRYGSNIDAMLGLGAISDRQGRLADANDWYRKVLEVEPRNEVANAGLLSIQQKNLPQSNESNIKSMLVTSPNDANLHAALGDIYASRGQWSAAQHAYFDAYRYYPSGENAFNLGVSLDQLGKPKLALPYYQEALQKAEQSNLIDAAALQARISSIQ